MACCLRILKQHEFHSFLWVLGELAARISVHRRKVRMHERFAVSP
jgi:hypothetical protein